MVCWEQPLELPTALCITWLEYLADLKSSLEFKENRNHSSLALINESVWSLSVCPKCLTEHTGTDQKILAHGVLQHCSLSSTQGLKELHWL